MKPFCFVLMPFGKKMDEAGRLIDFDVIYEQIIRPAIDAADLDPIRADKEMTGGVIHKAMFERLMLCDYAVADLTIANANVYYELGIRHGIRPHSTVLIFGQGARLPFDVSPLRGLPYALDASGKPTNAAADCDALAQRLRASRNPSEDSPLFQLVTDWPRPEVARLKMDVLRQVVEYSRQMKDKLQAARKDGVDAVRKVEQSLHLVDADPAVVVDLFLSYRAVEAWQDMVDLVPRMSAVLSRTMLVREQLAFALNRLKRGDEAEKLLLEVIAEFGASSETHGLLGRVYKDRYEQALNDKRMVEARGLLRKAIDTYVIGFNADIRDAYPGINTVTLMELSDTVDPRQATLLPVVRYAAQCRLESANVDYWDHATLMEVCILARDQSSAETALQDAVAIVREKWEPKTTARNVALIQGARARRNEETGWIGEIVTTLLQVADRFA